MTKVYVLTDGAYSDYRVVGVVSTLEAAENSKSEFLEMELVDEVPSPRLCYRIDVSHWDRLIEEPYVQELVVAFGDTLFDWATPRPRVHSSVYGDGRHLSLSVHGSDIRGVLKAYADRRGQLLAERVGIA